MWRAPETSTDCVLFQSTVIQSRTIWYLNENELTKRFCVIGLFFVLISHIFTE
jgi:hypothetical protein